MAAHRAGGSATAVAVRARAKATRPEHLATRPEAGAAGERGTAETLADLDPAAWAVFHDVAWPGRRRANIDHVAVGPGGVFVIDTKNWSGSVTTDGGVLRQNGRPQPKHVTSVENAAAAVRALVPIVPVHAVLCVSREEPMRGSLDRVMVCSTPTLGETLEARPHVLAPGEVSRIVAVLEASLQVAPREPAAPTAKRAAPKRKPRESATTDSPRRSLSGPVMKRLLAVLVVAALVVGGFSTGLFSTAQSTIVDFVSDVTGGDDAPKDKAGDRKRKKDRDQPRRNR